MTRIYMNKDNEEIDTKIFYTLEGQDVHMVINIIVATIYH